MNVLFFSHTGPRGRDANQYRRIECFARSFQKAGYKVHLLYIDYQKKLTSSERNEMSAVWDNFEHISFKGVRSKQKFSSKVTDSSALKYEVGERLKEICDNNDYNYFYCSLDCSLNLSEFIDSDVLCVSDAYSTSDEIIASILYRSKKLDLIVANDEMQCRNISRLTSCDALIISSDDSGQFTVGSEDAFDSAFSARSVANVVLHDVTNLNYKRASRARVVMLITHAKFWQPGWGSHVRIMQFVEELSRSYRVVVFFTSNLTEQDREELSRIDFSFDYEFVEEKVIWNRNSNDEVMTGKVSDPVISKKFRESIEKINPDVCIFEYLRFTYLLDFVSSRAIKIIDTHDLISRRQESRSLYERAVMVPRSSEIDSLLKYDYVITIQRTEAAIVQNWLGRANVLYVPICFENKILDKYNFDLNKEIVIGFIGGASEANLSGLHWFIDMVWPYFIGSNIKFHIAGDVGLKLKGPVNGVIVLGRTDLDEFYASLDFVINPVQWGGGMKIKTVEALSYGLPVISTSEGAAGLEEASSKGLSITDSPEEFAYLINEMSQNTAWREMQSNEAKLYVKSEFEREAVFRDLHDVIRSSILKI